MRHGIGLALLAATLAISACSNKGTTEKDSSGSIPGDEALYGTWTPTLMEYTREKTDKEIMDEIMAKPGRKFDTSSKPETILVKEKITDGDASVTFTRDGKVTIKHKGETLEGTFKVVAAGDGKAFKGIDTTANPDGKGNQEIHVIFQIDGDTLKIAKATGNKRERPTTFDPTKATVETYKRQKP
jgi:uncharacterized protein (TIGR03067 family)